MSDKKHYFRLKFDSESGSITCFVEAGVSRTVLDSVGKSRVIRFMDVLGDRHAVVMDGVFHVETGAIGPTIA